MSPPKLSVSDARQNASSRKRKGTESPADAGTPEDASSTRPQIKRRRASGKKDKCNEAVELEWPMYFEEVSF